MKNHSKLLEEVLALPDGQRAALACDILDTLPGDLGENDLTETKRRSKEMDENPELGVSWSEMKSSLGR